MKKLSFDLFWEAIEREQYIEVAGQQCGDPMVDTYQIVAFDGLLDLM